MKKLISLLMAASMTASLPVFPAYAEGNPDIESLAVSLGADTDYLAVPNYYYPISDLPSYDYFLPPSSNQTISLITGVEEYSDTSLGASVLSVLTHNGVISNDNVKINEIKHILLAKSIIFQYQNIIKDEKFDLYTKYLLKSQSLAQKADALVSTAEKCMKEGKYFLIMYSSIMDTRNYSAVTSGSSEISQKAHSAVGIGVTDGNWTFDGKIYDKCILTLDSYSVDEENDAFSEDTCIYINSETKEYYMPKISGYAENDLHIIAVDDDQLLNSGDTDVTDKIVNLDIASDSFTEVTYNDENGNSVVMNNDNDFLDNYHNKNNENFLIKGNDFKIHTSSQNVTDYVGIDTRDKKLDFSMGNSDSEIFCNDDTAKFTHKDSNRTYLHEKEPLEFTLNIKLTDSDVEHYIKGETLTESEFTRVDGGVIFSGGKAIFQNYCYNEEYLEDPDKEAYEILGQVAVNSTGKVFVRHNDDNSFTLFADLNNDGIFEHQVQKGDVNCDGQINADDASEVLRSYSEMSTDKYNDKTIYTDIAYADINNDGMINALDASEILEIYSENSTR